MTVQDARQILSGPLVFGDEKQIQAVRTIEKFEELEEKKKNAPNCEECCGKGEVECDHCDGTGYVDCEECDGTGSDADARPGTRVQMRPQRGRGRTDSRREDKK